MVLTEKDDKTLSKILRDLEEVNQDLSAFQHLTMIRNVRQQLGQVSAEIKQLKENQ